MKRRRRLLVALGIALALGAAEAAVFAVWTRYGQGPRAPTIGISVSSSWYDAARLNPAPYAAALARAGANVVVIDSGDLDRIERLDGLLLVGGGDVDPKLYGGTAGYRVDRRHDDFEIDLLRRAEARGIPVLAICRGAQLLVVAHGGKLATLEAESARRHQVALKSLAAHTVRIGPESRLRAGMGEGPHTVSSTHVQAISDPGPRLRATGVAEDGVVEAVELPGPRLVMGLQWHPEIESLAEGPQLVPFRLLVDAARR